MGAMLLGGRAISSRMSSSSACDDTTSQSGPGGVGWGGAAGRDLELLELRVRVSVPFVVAMEEAAEQILERVVGVHLGRERRRRRRDRHLQLRPPRSSAALAVGRGAPH